MPERVQLRRTRGWRKPEGTVVVSRPSRWGNMFWPGQRVISPGAYACEASPYLGLLPCGEYAGPYPPFAVVHGAARGADRLADRAAREFGLAREPHRADWHASCRDTCTPGHRRPREDGRTICPAAGNYRNQAMVDLGADLLLAFFRAGAANIGTADCVRRADAAGIKVERITA